MQSKPAVTRIPLHDIIGSRWSPRAFDASKPVPKNDLLALLEAARWAPSCFNDQPWRFIVFDKAGNVDNWQRMYSLLSEKNRLWACNAPVLILSVSMEHFNHNGAPNRWAMYDTGAASLSLCLQATAMGLCVHQMGGFDAVKAREMFKLPDDCTPMAVLAVGYQADAAILSGDLQKNETAERSRAALSERFFLGQWGEGFAE